VDFNKLTEEEAMREPFRFERPKAAEPAAA
jgi:hypothetical protein